MQRFGYRLYFSGFGVCNGRLTGVTIFKFCVEVGDRPEILEGFLFRSSNPSLAGEGRNQAQSIRFKVWLDGILAMGGVVMAGKLGNGGTEGTGTEIVAESTRSKSIDSEPNWQQGA
ncbi:MAG: hypothetical protein F6K16_43240, partial [Symploca sp. SIO2B6]|nr:hypothetical protein [Symploca sp. SIO2B6]